MLTIRRGRAPLQQKGKGEKMQVTVREVRGIRRGGRGKSREGSLI